MNCLYCNKPLSGLQKRYCSASHRKMAWKKRNWRKVLDYNNQLARKKSYKPEEKLCIVCEKVFLTTKFNPHQKYCSTKCKLKVNQSPARRKIWRKNYRDNNLKEIKEKDNKYKARTRFGTISKTLNKIIVLKRDNKTCRLCGNPYQIIHHIKYSGKYEDLVCLCRACHASIHQRVKEEPYW